MDINNTTTIESAGNIEENPKYKQLEQMFREKEAEVEKVRAMGAEMEQKYQKLIGDFGLFRNKA
jgi:hypothetical protein